MKPEDKYYIAEHYLKKRVVVAWTIAFINLLGSIGLIQLFNYIPLENSPKNYILAIYLILSCIFMTIILPLFIGSGIKMEE